MTQNYRVLHKDSQLPNLFGIILCNFGDHMKSIAHKRKSIILILLIILVMSNFTITFAYWTSTIQGSFTQNNATVNIGNWPFVPPGSTVLTEEVLIDLLNGDLPLDGDYVLVGDIDLSTYENNEFDPISNFTGTFEGNGYTIGGFTINNTNTTPGTEIGIFINTGVDSEISNVNVENVTVTQTDNSGGSNTNETTYIGVLVGTNNGTISNVEVLDSQINGGNIVNSGIFNSSSLSLYAGGLVGRNNGTIINSYARVNVTLNSSVSTSFLSSSTGTTYVGGLVGYNMGTISQSYATGNVLNDVDTSTGFLATVTINTYTGGLVGLNASGGNVFEVFATGNVTLEIEGNSGSQYLGRVVGRNLGNTSELYRLNTQSITTGYIQNSANTISTTIENLQSSVFLSETLGFDFVNVWEPVVGDYPILKE